jgi:hypothetical protein
MDDITLNLIALAFFVLLGGTVFLLVRRRKAKTEQQILQMAAENGCTVETIREPLTWGLRLASANWTLQALSRSNGTDSASGASNVEMSTIWRAPVPGSTLLIGPRSSQANLGGMGEMLTRKVLELALGAGAEGLKEVQAGSESLRQKYMLWAQEPVELENLLTPAFENALLTWKSEPVFIKRTAGELSIELRGVRLQKADELRAMLQLGELSYEALHLKRKAL